MLWQQGRQVASWSEDRQTRSMEACFLWTLLCLSLLLRTWSRKSLTRVPMACASADPRSIHVIHGLSVLQLTSDTVTLTIMDRFHYLFTSLHSSLRLPFFLPCISEIGTNLVGQSGLKILAILLPHQTRGVIADTTSSHTTILYRFVSWFSEFSMLCERGSNVIFFLWQCVMYLILLQVKLTFWNLRGVEFSQVLRTQLNILCIFISYTTMYRTTENNSPLYLVFFSGSNEAEFSTWL